MNVYLCAFDFKFVGLNLTELLSTFLFNLSLIGGSCCVPPSASPVRMMPFARFSLDFVHMRTEVIPLSLKYKEIRVNSTLISHAMICITWIKLAGKRADLKAS